MPDIEVKTLKSFLTDEGYVKKNTPITVDEFRARELLRNGLIEGYDVKKAQEPENKKAAEPANKGGKGTAAKQKG